jgi:hypothetical protein
VIEQTDSPEFCNSCHIMDSAFGSFQESNHAHLDCNDCHAPTDSLLTKMSFKARAGAGHMYMNTIGRGEIPDVLHATSELRRRRERQLHQCHEPSFSGLPRREGDLLGLPPVGAPRPRHVPPRRVARADAHPGADRTDRGRPAVTQEVSRSCGGSRCVSLRNPRVASTVLLDGRRRCWWRAACTSDPIPEVEEPRDTDLPADAFHVSASRTSSRGTSRATCATAAVDEYVSKLTVDIEPDLPILWSNLAFSKSYNYPRGHTFGLEDVLATPRIGDASIGSCMTCKSTAVPTLLEEFGDDYWSASFNEEIVPA